MSVRVEVCDPDARQVPDRNVFLRFVADGRGTFAFPPMTLEEAISASEQFAAKVKELSR
jgi:hypothetical protein